MASSKEYIEFVLEQCNGLSSRAMMGEYVLYYGGKVVGGVYDNRLLVKPTKSAMALMPNADYQLPYDGAKEMILVEDIENRDFLKELFEAVCQELPEPKKKK
ncbi:MAG: competence protein TfoX [Clostridia bacterium]|nr:competence protein TfoX [Clostridia bacterium]